MKIGLYGNTANNFFQLGRALREEAGLDVTLYIDLNFGATTRPESDDPALADGLPDWIVEGDWLSREALMRPWRAPITRELQRHDVVVASGVAPIFTQFSGRPWAFYTTGGDLTIWPFPIRFRNEAAHAKDFAFRSVMGAWQRRGIRRADEIWTQPFFPFRRAAERLKLDPERVADVYLPVIFDAARYTPRTAGSEARGSLAHELTQRSDFIVFHPSRLMIQDDERLRETGQWKANDKLIRGFAKFVAERPELRPVLAMPDRKESPDVGIAKELIAELGIEESIAWLRPPDGMAFTRSELADLYAVADVVPDDFGAGWFGAVVLEAMSMEKPVLSFVDESVMSKLYPWHPIVQAENVDEIGAALVRLADSPDERAAIGRRGREWVLEFHAYEAVAKRYVEEIGRLLRLTGTNGSTPPTA